MSAVCRHFFPEWGTKLLCPLGMATAPMDTIMLTTNGCGRAGIEEKLVPDTIWGLDISPVCRVHDWMYSDADTLDDEEFADGVFAANLVAYIRQKSANRFMAALRLHRAYLYIDAVALTDLVEDGAT